MTLQTLAIFLFSWVLPDERPLDREEDLPRWERHPAEQRHLREQAAREALLRTRFPQSW